MLYFLYPKVKEDPELTRLYVLSIIQKLKIQQGQKKKKKPLQTVLCQLRPVPENAHVLMKTEMSLKEVWGARLDVYPLHRKRHWVFKPKTSDIQPEKRQLSYEDFNRKRNYRCVQNSHSSQ